jgi:hypothetical protein
MKKKQSIKKLSLTRQTIQNLNKIKGGGGPLAAAIAATGCMCGTGASCGIICHEF